MKEWRTLFIGGSWVGSDGGDSIDVHSPATEELVGRVPRATSSDVDRAAVAAREAFDSGPWPRLSLEDRIAIVEEAKAGLIRRTDELATLLTLEQGTPYVQARAGVTGSPINYIDDAVAAARSLLAHDEIRRDSSGSTLIVQDPVGVCASITPFNGPLITAVLKTVPAILAGCTVVLKPSPLTPLDNYVFAEIFEAAGLPAGVLNLVQGDARVGEHLVRHPAIDKVAFTGSSAAGRQIASICGQQLKRMHMELGGKSAAIVLEDADISTCLPKLAAGALASQVCIALSRVLVPRSRHDEIVDALCQAAKSRRPGDPFDPGTTMSPLISEHQRNAVEEAIRMAVADGCKLAGGGQRPADADRGFYLEPAVITGVDNSMRIARQEVFGPVASVITYDSVDEAVAIANDSEYGLHGAVFTSDPAAAIAVARRVRTGTFGINTFGFHISSPMGGVRGSGFGREHGVEGLAEYLAPKAITLPAGFDEAF